MSVRRPSYWESNLPEPSGPDAVPEACDLLIVGAGFMGRWLAYWARQRAPTLRIVVVERDHFGYGASSRNAGFLTTGQLSEYLDDLQACGDFERVAKCFAARREGVALVRHCFPGLKLDPCGAADFDGMTPASCELAERLHRAFGKRVFVQKTLQLGAEARDVHFNCDEAGLNPVELLHCLRQACPDVHFVFGQRVDALAAGRARLGVRRLRYSRAVICTNGFARELVPGHPVEPARGQIILTSPVHSRTSRVLGYRNRGYLYWRFVDGRLLLGGGRDRFRDQECSTELQTTQVVFDYLKQEARTIIGHDDFSVVQHWAGIMGMPKGAHIGELSPHRLDSQTDVVAGFGGMGVALTPIVARDYVEQRL